MTLKDPTGAGDTFNATFLHGLLEEWSIKKITKYANLLLQDLPCILGQKGG